MNLGKTYGAISRAVGDSAARTLVHVYPGARVYIPKPERLDASHPIATLIGVPLALRLCDEFGGALLVVPTPLAIRQAGRDARIVQMWRSGKTARSLALHFGIDERSVYRIIERST